MTEMPSAIERLAALHADTEIWWDSSPLVYEGWRAETRGADSAAPALTGELSRLWDPKHSADGLLRGATTNPPLAWQAVQADLPRWEATAREAARISGDADEHLWRVYGEICRAGAARLLPLYQASSGRYGHVCAQVDPRQLTDTEAMLAQAHRLHALSPNVMIKMPATREGIAGLRILSSAGIATTATLCFSVAQLTAVAEAARAGYRDARAAGRDLRGARCCAALMLGRMEDVPRFRQEAAARGIALSDEDLRWAGVAIARRAYAIYRERGYETRLLCASMRLGPTVDGATRIWHLEQLAGGAMVLTIFPNILTSFLELYRDRPLTPRIEEPVPAEVLGMLLQVPYFREAWEEDGVAPEGFIDLPGVQATGRSFAEAMDTLEAWTRSVYGSCRR
ncbi:MAG TPA: transaldolase family protein [Armatimonadota bacterium]|nr:transaldolase family protein [Armatimonadota bacterium]